MAPAVAVLYARRDSTYKTIPGVDVWDEDRDARKWPGGSPLVAHPPCRLWGRLAQFAKARDEEEERNLAISAVWAIRQFGGVLEHPATSKLWPTMGLPAPGQRDGWGGYTLPILQSWWGHRAPKATNLYIVGVKPADLPPIPYQLGTPAGRVENMCRAEREHTPPELAQWLVQVARAAA